MRQDVKLEHASRLVNHGPTVLVSSAHGGKLNVMAAAWSMPVEFTPPRIAVVIDKSTYTRELITASGRLALSLPCRANADAAYTVGSVGGRDCVSGRDKFDEYGIGHFAGPVLGLPLVEGCWAHIAHSSATRRKISGIYIDCLATPRERAVLFVRANGNSLARVWRVAHRDHDDATNGIVDYRQRPL